MDEVLTIAQIEAHLSRSEEPRTNEALEVQSGRVRWHSKDREEVYRKAVEVRVKRFAILHTGKTPEGTEIVLWISRSICNRGKRNRVCASRSPGSDLRFGARALRVSRAGSHLAAERRA